MRAICRLLATSSVLFLLTGCTTFASLSTKRQGANDAVAAKQPIVTQGGTATEKNSEKIVARVTGANTDSEEQKVDRLVDDVRRSLSAPLTTGNKVGILVDGPATFVAIDAAIAQARQHVHVETYIFSDDEFGRKFANLLIRKRREGVVVRVIYDAVGSIDTKTEFFEELQLAGVDVIEFQPLNPLKTMFWKMHNRDHRKIIVIDGLVAFTGGMNISNAYSSGSSTKPGPESGLEEGWRDTHMQIEGPAVEQFQKMFLNTWSALGGKLPEDRSSYYPTLVAQGDNLVSAVESSGFKQQDEAIYQTYIAAIQSCSRRIWITQAYLLPPKDLRAALIAAVKRGVDVRIIVPGFTDSKLVLHASHREYDRLLAGGIRLFETKDALLHAKTALIDDAVTIIGSANLDYRSFLHNNEVTAVVVNAATAQRMETIFRRDLEQSKEITLQTWRSRSLWLRAQEAMSGLLKFWL